jgi:hypothetical protein
VAVPLVHANHVRVDEHSCRNTCSKCDHTWAFDVTDSRRESNYCYQPDSRFFK